MEEREFFESIRDEKNIVIYGAKKMAQELIKRMKYIGIIPAFSALRSAKKSLADTVYIVFSKLPFV